MTELTEKEEHAGTAVRGFVPGHDKALLKQAYRLV